MAEASGEGKPRQEITISRDAGPTGQSAGNAREAGHRLPTQQELFERMRRVPKGEEPAYWPVCVMTELDYLTAPEEWPDSPLTEKWAPVRESFLRVKKAYEVLAYPHIQYEVSRENIEVELEMDRQIHGRDQLNLDGAEVRILGKLAATAEIPFDPQKKIIRLFRCSYFTIC